MRKFVLKGFPKIIFCKNEKDCLFCKHCTDIFWDYTNGIYMIICDLGEETFKENCRYFEESYLAHWKEYNDVYICSNCHYMFKEKYEICKNCGCYMRGNDNG